MSASLLPYVPFVFLALFFASVLVDRRRFRNGVYLLLFLISFTLLEYGDSALGKIAGYMILFWLFLILVVPALLILNGFTMVRREGFRLTSILSLLFGAAIIAGEIFFLIGMGKRQIGYAVCGWIAVYVSLIFLAFLFYSLIIQVIPRRIRFDYVIVLGAGLIGGMRVSPLLASRLDKGIRVYRRSRGGKIICSGGKGADEKISEAQAMKDYLLEQGVPEDRILLEDQSSTTMENLANSRSLIRKFPGGKKTAVVTSSYHVLRALIYARKLDMPLTGIGSKVALYFWPSAMVREYAALIRCYALPYFLGLAGFTGGMALLTLRLFSQMQ